MKGDFNIQTWSESFYIANCCMFGINTSRQLFKEEDHHINTLKAENMCSNFWN